MAASHFEEIEEDDGYYTNQEVAQWEKEDKSGVLFSQQMDVGQIRWQRGGLIGAGAFGKVFLGLNLDNGELLAVKQVALVGDFRQQEKEVRSGSFQRILVPY